MIILTDLDNGLIYILISIDLSINFYINNYLNTLKLNVKFVNPISNN